MLSKDVEQFDHRDVSPRNEFTFQIAVNTQYIKAGETLVLYKCLGEKKESVDKGSHLGEEN